MPMLLIEDHFDKVDGPGVHYLECSPSPHYKLSTVETLSRKHILDKVEKWMLARGEESWLENYNREENRYNSSRGTHINLKRVENARILDTKFQYKEDDSITHLGSDYWLTRKTKPYDEVAGCMAN